MRDESISVIVPVYNGEHFVVAAINSVLAQTVLPGQIVIIDDASTDRTQDVIYAAFSKQMADGLILYERNEQNKERSYSRNRGADLASGAYIFFLDHDDLWDPAYLATVMEIFAQKDSDVVYAFPRTFVDENGSVLRTSSKRISSDHNELVFGSHVGYPSATAFKRSSFSGYTDACILREDWEIFLRASLAGQRVDILDRDLVKMRAHGGRTSNSVKFWVSTLQVFDTYKNSVPSPYRGLFSYHVADICLRYGDLPHGWLITMRTALKGYCPGFRFVWRLVTRGVRVDRYFRLAEQRRRFSRKQ